MKPDTREAGLEALTNTTMTGRSVLQRKTRSATRPLFGRKGWLLGNWKDYCCDFLST